MNCGLVVAKEKSFDFVFLEECIYFSYTETLSVSSSNYRDSNLLFFFLPYVGLF